MTFLWIAVSIVGVIMGGLAFWAFERNYPNPGTLLTLFALTLTIGSVVGLVLEHNKQEKASVQALVTSNGSLQEVFSQMEASDCSAEELRGWVDKARQAMKKGGTVFFDKCPYQRVLYAPNKAFFDQVFARACHEQALSVEDQHRRGQGLFIQFSCYA
jgi:uncharacterized membrane protein YraQ (UPF0718 family)